MRVRDAGLGVLLHRDNHAPGWFIYRKTEKIVSGAWLEDGRRIENGKEWDLEHFSTLDGCKLGDSECKVVDFLIIPECYA